MNIFENILGPSWRTSLIALMGGMGVIFTQAYYGLDNDPKTVLQPEIVWGAITAVFFGIFTRDKSTSDQESGIPPERTGAGALAKYEMKHGTGDGSQLS